MDDMDCNCDLGDCDCDCDCDCCCCCGDECDCDCDLGDCFGFGSSSDDHASTICIDIHGQGKHNEDPGCWYYYCCCCCEDTSKRRESTQINKAPKPEKKDKKQDEKRRKKESEGKNSLMSATYCSCHEPISQRMPICPKCGGSSSISSSLDPPMTQRFQRPDWEKYAAYNRKL